jgi:hypothetical protein
VTNEIKHMSVKEFREAGYLQEANRLFFHPLGIALSVEIHEDGSESFGPIWDDRDDPEGTRYGPGMIDRAKAERVRTERVAKSSWRLGLLGYLVQPANRESS